MQPTDDLRVESLRPLIPPAILLEEIPAAVAVQKRVSETRATVAAIIHGKDPRLLVVVGPCSVHDPDAAREYGSRLRKLADTVSDELFLVMRTYFEKPRTTVGWKGLINDPDLDGSFQINKGLRRARTLLNDLVALGLAVGTEFLDPITPQYVADLVSWGSIGARTSESQTHREMSSGLSMPIGFKNATSGAVQVAIDAICAAQNRHRFLGVTKQGLSAIVTTRGNPDCHLILRGGRNAPNYREENIAAAAEALVKAQVTARVMVDCSHDNSGKDHEKQPTVAKEVARQVGQGSQTIFGVMLESFLESGRQALKDARELTYGRSITDACIDWKTTEKVVGMLAEGARARRS